MKESRTKAEETYTANDCINLAGDLFKIFGDNYTGLCEEDVSDIDLEVMAEVLSTASNGAQLDQARVDSAFQCIDRLVRLHQKDPYRLKNIYMSGSEPTKSVEVADSLVDYTIGYLLLQEETVGETIEAAKKARGDALEKAVGVAIDQFLEEQGLDELPW